MAAQTFQRVVMHPWLWKNLISTAVKEVKGNEDGAKQKALSFWKAFREKFTEDDKPVQNPYSRWTKKQKAEVEARNAAILAEDADFGYWREAKLQRNDAGDVTGIISYGYVPLPDPSLKGTLVLLPGVVEFLEKAVKAFRDSKDTGSGEDVLESIEDALKALGDAETFTVNPDPVEEGAKTPLKALP